MFQSTRRDSLPMARPLPLECAGTFYHVAVLDDRQERIFLNDSDRPTFLDQPSKEVAQQGCGGATPTV